MTGDPMAPALLILNIALSMVSFLPLSDGRPRRSKPPMTTLLLVVTNVAAFVSLNLLGPIWLGDEQAYETAVKGLLMTPSDLLNRQGLGAISVLTAAFLHGDIWHLVGNMLFLVFFGRKVEDVLGSLRFALFYGLGILISGAASVLASSAMPLGAGDIPTLGASGAVMAVMAAYLFLFSHERIRALAILAILPLPLPVRMPVWTFVVYHAASDVAGGWLEQVAQEAGTRFSFIDFFAHLGGFVAGLTVIYLLLPKEAFGRDCP